ncbi:hypothetical protein JG688_00015650 [Phytophthora aleatoria]|uniref:Uncharacterized protein n=1 Tax=Phytophthora aleatoria TaxID=2496075 RepID=A0A8J5MDA7_9STRA|nr:hypothetical protein JG688_00015650 [Phytophthora aleatoria]
MRYQGADDELQNLAKKVSYHAYELVEKQYRVANGRKTYFTIRELQPSLYELTSAVKSLLHIILIIYYDMKLIKKFLLLMMILFKMIY